MSVMLLPQEIYIDIFSKLDIKSACRISRVCKLWKLVSEDDYIWRTVGKGPLQKNLYYCNQSKVRKLSLKEKIRKLYTKNRMCEQCCVRIPPRGHVSKKLYFSFGVNWCYNCTKENSIYLKKVPTGCMCETCVKTIIKAIPRIALYRTIFQNRSHQEDELWTTEIVQIWRKNIVSITLAHPLGSILIYIEKPRRFPTYPFY